MEYSLPENVKIYHRRNKTIIINPDIPAWVVTDSLGELIVSLFKTPITVAEVVGLAVDGLGEEARPKVEAFCKYLVNSRLFEKPERENFRGYRLNMVHLSLSENCNLHCHYCYAAERKEQGERKMSLDDYKKTVDELLEINPKVGFTITGGEPLLNPLWKDVAKYIKDKGAYLLLLTNGTLINERNVAYIRELFDLVTISIDGSTREVHKLTRGDNYDKVVRALDLLSRNGVDYTLSMTVTRKNIGDVEAMAAKYGSRLNFAPLFPVSDLANDEFSITGKQYYKALKEAAGVAPLSYCESTLDRSLHEKCFKCALGDGEISISPTGDVYPCQLLHVKDMYCGNIFRETVSDIYNNSQVLKRCRSAVVDNVEGCKDCGIKYICGGACRARAYYECGDIMKNGAFCEYELEAFLDGIIDIYSNNLIPSENEESQKCDNQ